MKHWFGASRRKRAFALRRSQPLCLEPLEDRTLLSTFFVVNANDTGAGYANYGDLRYCITQANATPGPNVIQFALSTNPPGTSAASPAHDAPAVQTIHLHSALPALTNTVTLDGWSQGGADYAGAPLIELDGSEVAYGSGLVLAASHCVVRGLAINNFGYFGLAVAASSANDWVYGCSFGVAPDGLHAAANSAGVYLGGSNTLLGTNADGVHDAAEGNLISGNNGYGVLVVGSGNTLAGNLIGLGTDGSTALGLGNLGAGVLVFGADNTLGGAAAGAGNVISANIGSGVLIAGPWATGNVVRGNLIGTDASGLLERGNSGDGVVITDGAAGNIIGGSAPGERNVISSNHAAGVALGRFGAAGADNRVLGNFIGVNADGTAALGNHFEGILINNGSDSEGIGGSGLGEGNLISGNGLFGLNIINATNNTVQGNLIGILPDGVTAAPNALGGIAVQSTFLTTTGNLIGGTTAGAGNVISGNAGPGVLLAGMGVLGNVLAGNRIGTAAGGAPLGNAGDGVRLEAGASRNTIGVETPGAGNRIAYNAKGVVITGEDSTGNSILGNSIFGNTGLGIDLGDDGVTPNGTPPPGPNNFQPHPVLLSMRDGQIAGSLHAAAGVTYRIELFASPVSGPAGQGQTFLGSVLVTTDANGLAFFLVPVTLSAGEVVTATATNSATGDTSEFSAPAPDLPPAVSVGSQGGLLVANTGQSASLSGFFTDPDSHSWTATINYGDGSGVQPLVLAPDHTFTLDHVYGHEGNYFVTVAITDDDGEVGFARVPVIVFDSGVQVGQVGQGTAPPGDSTTITASGITATLYRDASDDPTENAFLLLAPVAENTIAQLNGGSSPIGPDMLASAYDIRSLNLTAQDKAVITFQYPPGMGLPTLQYFDAASHSFKPVLGSTLQPDSLVIDPVHRTITLTFDASSTPRLGDLVGTVFLVSIPQESVTAPPPSPPVPPSPPPAPLPPSSTGPSMMTTTATASPATATTGTTTASTPFLATSLPSGSPSSSISGGNTQLASNNSSANGISAFSPFFVLIITAARPTLSENDTEAGAATETNPSTAPAPSVLSLLNRLPRVPASEDHFTPPPSEPNAVLSPSRAGLPEGADKPETPPPPPAPAPPPAANHLPRLGFRLRSTDREMVNEREMPAFFEDDTEEGTVWFDGVLSEILGRLAWSEREEGHTPLHPAVALLALGTGLLPRMAQRTPLAARTRERLPEEIAE